MTDDLISVIVPVYNVEHYVGKCIESILGQTYSNLEIILVNDGSTDRSGLICEEWARKDGRIRVLHKENGGLSDARNAGIEISSGTWIMFVDSDDTITPDTIDRLYQAAMDNECEIAVCNIVRIYDDGTTEPFYTPVSELTILDGQQRFETLKQPSACNKLFRRDILGEVRFPIGKYYEDTFVYHIWVHRAKRIVMTGHDGYYYLSRRESILGQPKYTERYFDFIEAVYMRASYLLKYQVPYYGEEACLSLYAAVSDGEKHLVKTEENTRKFEQMHRWYKVAYDHLIHHPDIGIKQRLRLILLRYFPALHSRIY